MLSPGDRLGPWALAALEHPNILTLHDVGSDQERPHLIFELVEGQTLRQRATAPSGSLERDLCPFSWCLNPKLGPDGMQLALWDWTVNPVHSVDSGWCYLRSTSGGPAVRLGEGSPLAVSPDGDWVLVSRGPTLELLPTGSGPPRRLNSEGLSRMGLAWMSQGNEVFVVADDSSGERRTFLIGHEGARPVPVTPAGARGLGGPVNGRLLASTSDGTLAWYPLSGGEPLAVGTKRQPGTNVAGLSADGRFLYEGEFGVPGRIHRLDLATRQRVLWKVVQPDDPAGFVGSYGIAVSRDGRAYAYSYLRLLQDLYLVDGVR